MLVLAPPPRRIFLDILVDNAAHQASFRSIEDISDEEWDVTFRTTIYSMFYLCKAAIPHMKPGGAIVHLARATVRATAQLVAEKGIRVNAVASGPIWTRHRRRDSRGDPRDRGHLLRLRGAARGRSDQQG